jgi:hypothetical protein
MIRVRRRRDDTAVALVAFGVTGLGLLLAAAVLLVGALGAAERLAAAADASDPAGLGARLDRVSASLDEAEAALRGFDATLGATAAAARDGQRLGEQLAASLRRLAAELDLSVLGSQPFAGLRADFDAVADDADALALDLARTAGSLDANRDALARLGGEVAGLRQELAGLRAEVAPGGASGGPSLADSIGLARIVLVALLAWLAVPAAAAVLTGARRLRGARVRGLLERPG